MHFVDIDSLAIGGEDSEVIGYVTGVHVDAAYSDRRDITTTSITNVRVRYSTESIRDETIGFLLEGTIEGGFSDNEIEGYDIGICYTGGGGKGSVPGECSL